MKNYRLASLTFLTLGLFSIAALGQDYQTRIEQGLADPDNVLIFKIKALSHSQNYK